MEKKKWKDDENIKNKTEKSENDKTIKTERKRKKNE